MLQDVVSIGQAHTCDLRLKGANILDRHIQIERRGKQLYCRPAMRDPSNFLIDTLTWLDGQPLRQGTGNGSYQQCGEDLGAC